MVKSILGKWDYSKIDSVCYGDVQQESYKKSAEFLGDSVEDWGCGTGWSKRFFKNYRGVDGSAHYNVDEVVDLAEYTSGVDNILMRQVLELNQDWEQILKNVKQSFRKKFCLIVFTPFAQETYVAERDGEIDIIYFNKQDILDFFPKEEFKVREETVSTDQGYKQDWILYVERL